jgi:hypothetical protein
MYYWNNETWSVLHKTNSYLYSSLSTTEPIENILTPEIAAVTYPNGHNSKKKTCFIKWRWYLSHRFSYRVYRAHISLQF